MIPGGLSLSVNQFDTKDDIFLDNGKNENLSYYFDKGATKL